MMGNIFPHAIEDCLAEVPLVEDAVPPLCNPVVGFLYPGFRRLQGLHGG
jgi:hypothetical protein